MVTQELLVYIRGELGKGRTREEIHALLVQHGGWTEQDMAEAFALATPPKAPAPLQPTAPAPSGAVTPAQTGTPSPLIETQAPVASQSAAAAQPQSEPAVQPIEIAAAAPAAAPLQPQSTTPITQPTAAPTMQTQVQPSVDAQPNVQQYASPAQPAMAAPTPAELLAQLQTMQAAQNAAAHSVSAPVAAAASAPTLRAHDGNYFFTGGVLYIVATIVSFVVGIAGFGSHVAAVAANSSMLIAVIALIVIAFWINAFVIHSLSKTFQAASHSWARAALLVGVGSACSALFTIARSLTAASVLLLLGTLLLGVIVFIIVAERMYAIRSLRAFALWLCSIAIMSALLFAGKSVLAPLLGSPQYPAAQNYRIPDQQGAYFQQ